jgi:hypothetical protein
VNRAQPQPRGINRDHAHSTATTSGIASPVPGLLLDCNVMAESGGMIRVAASHSSDLECGE